MTAGGAQLEDLLGLVASGDRGAFADLYDRTSARVYGMVLRVLRDQGYSEEVTQEVYLQVWREARNFRPDRGSAVSWLLTIAHRRAVDRVRSERSASDRDTRYGVRELVEITAGVEEEVLSRENGRRARECLGALTALQAQAVSLAFYEGFTYREVAERLTVPLPTVKSRIKDGLKRLRGCLGGE
ncbi:MULTISPECIES: ECF RNA polymerase sigma factor SigK [Gordonia]|uniref:RNA polymerase sigma factor n=1 Tax=Gordonia cholesterolivorans TaxID=559625 RepID=A0ABP5U3H9_9ACTN|nr:ECF RNA polymerase sigma factor SigK [Gordonia sihwensis]WFN93423.1 ECF RNA polymerase sigma factor SigK [Gordonia sihwensis]